MRGPDAPMLASGTEIAGDHRDRSLVRSRLHGIVRLLKLKLVRLNQRRCAGGSDGHFGFDGGLGQAGSCSQWRKRIGKVCLSNLLERLVDSDGLGWPSRMHDEHDGSNAPATRIAAIPFADCDYSFIVGVDGRSGMLFQFKHRVPSVVRPFPWEEKKCHLQHRA
jgi:hypothetical protein